MRFSRGENPTFNRFVIAIRRTSRGAMHRRVLVERNGEGIRKKKEEKKRVTSFRDPPHFAAAHTKDLLAMFRRPSDRLAAAIDFRLNAQLAGSI